ncbi:DUF1648 domain-containing protein [Agromyces sp. MMS24-K17]|uniref:DUF1648 domain-containing protein n=1 Tax=Agromyces sp. MMS24-K17 TaxID=3372850 RepID=UPI003755353D
MTDRRHEASADAATDLAARDRHDRRTLWTVVVWIPVAITLAATAVLVAWAPRLPAEVVTKWGVDGQPTQTVTPVGLVFVYLGVSGLLIVILALAAFLGGRSAARAAARQEREVAGFASAPSRLALARPIAVFAPATTALIAIVMLGLTGVQLDGTTSPSGWTVAGIIVGAVVVAGGIALVTWRALPAPERAGAVRATPALALAPGERAAWTATAHAPWPVVVLVFVGLGLCLLPVVLIPSWWPLSLLLVVVIGFAATTLSVRVTVDRHGLVVRTLVGIRVGRVRLDQAVAAADVTIDPAAFGGWGFRFDGLGRRGIILRAGSAIEVERRDAPPFVVTVPDARTGAALLNALVAAAGR